jgi:hypothetical protein
MCFFFSLFPATFWLVIGYFVLFSSGKAKGRIQKFGKILAIWIFILALFIVICGIYMTLFGNCPIEKIMQNMEMP